MQARWAREADDALGEHPLPTDYDAIDSLRYTEAVLRETLRLKPPGPHLFMESLADRTIAGTHIPAGTRLFLLVRHAGLESGGLDRPQGVAEEAARRSVHPRIRPRRAVAGLAAAVEV